MAKRLVVVWTAPALEDLDIIADYIALDNQAAASKLVGKIVTAVERLAKFPNLGRKVPELPALPYREVVVSPCRVLYRIESQRLYVVMVTRGEQLMEEHRLWRWSEN
jgi:toxin ParE1/3/4